MDIKTLPLDIEELKEILTNPDLKDKRILVNYEGSTIKEQAFINYIKNLELKIDLINSDAALLDLYIKNKYELDIPYLCEAYCNKLLDISDQDDYLSSVRYFLSSLLYTIPFQCDQYKNTIGQGLIDNGTMILIDEEVPIWPNLLSVLKIEGFLEYYLVRGFKIDKPAYFKRQLEDNFYQGNSLFAHLIEMDHSLIVLYRGLLENWFTPKELKEALSG